MAIQMILDNVFEENEIKVKCGNKYCVNIFQVVKYVPIDFVLIVYNLICL